MSGYPRAVLTRAARPPDAVLRYGPRVDQVADLHLPPGPGSAARPGALLVLLHGGFWRAAYDRTHTRPLAAALADDGWVVATPEYRRSGEPGQPGACWPTTSADVALAVRTLPALVADLRRPHAAPAAHPGPPDPVSAPVVLGHSAGGHLALWLAARLGPDALRAVLAVGAVADLREAYELDLDAGAVEALLGVAPGVRRFTEADPCQLPAPVVPVVLVHGVDDAQVPVGLSRRYHAAHPATRLVELPGVDHFAPIDPEQQAGAAVIGLVRDLRADDLEGTRG